MKNGTKFENGELRTDYIVLVAALICKGYKLQRASLDAQGTPEFCFAETPELRKDVGTFYRFDFKVPVRQFARVLADVRNKQRDLNKAQHREGEALSSARVWQQQ